MTIDDFIAELGRVSDQFRWILVPDEGRHAERRTQPRSRLRGIARSGSSKHMTLEPLAAVCCARSKAIGQSWLSTADKLGLALADARLLIAASNDSTWRGEPGHRKPDEHLESLRARLIEAVGLSVPESARNKSRNQ